MLIWKSRRCVRGRGRALSVAVTVLGALLFGTPAASGSPTVGDIRELDLESLAAMVVHPTRELIFFSEGAGTASILVTRHDGTPVGRIHNQQGATGMALSADARTLYVALSNGNAISAIDTATLTETRRYGLGSDVCPRWLAVTQGRVWATHGCSSWTDLGVLEPLSGAWSSYSARRYGGLVSASPGAPGTLVLGDHGLSPSRVEVVDVSAGEPTSVAERDVGSNLRDIRLTDDGSTVLTASGSPYYAQAFSMRDLSQTGVYDTGPYPNAVAASDELVVAGADASYSPDLYVFDRATNEPLGAIELVGATGTLATRGLAFLPGDDLIVAVSSVRHAESPRFYLHVLDPRDPVGGRLLRVPASTPTDAAVWSSEARFGDGAAPHAVLSRDDVFADSLAGSALTGEAPLLFTGTNTLPAATREELRRALGPGRTVYLLGGPSAIAPAVEDELRAMGFTTRRLAGASRVETSIAVADEVLRRYPGSVVAVARAFGTAADPTAAWADSVTGGAWAAAYGVPLVVTPGEELHGAVASALGRWRPEATVLLGGTAALSDTVQRAVPNPVRVAGADRAQTAQRIAEDLWDGDGRAYVVTPGWRADGWAFGFAAAGLASDLDAPVLLSTHDHVPGPTLSSVRSMGCNGDWFVVLNGSPSILSEQVRETLRSAATDC